MPDNPCKEIRLIQDNELRNPAYNGQFPIPTLQEYIDGKPWHRKNEVKRNFVEEFNIKWQRVQIERLEYIPS